MFRPIIWAFLEHAGCQKEIPSDNQHVQTRNKPTQIQEDRMHIYASRQHTNEYVQRTITHHTK
jgi:hypothetical protein